MGGLRRRAAVLVVALLSACGPAPLVVQGTVIGVDDAAETVTVRDELAPSRELVISLQGAEVGSPPEVGDLVRIAYRDEAGRAAALRLMNLTRQEELARGHRR
jgi:hypothetical protein